MMSLPGEFSRGDRFCTAERVGRGVGGVYPQGENGASQALGSLWSAAARSLEGHMLCC